MSTPKVHVRINTLDVESTPANDAMHCPIASQLKASDEDIHHPYVTRETISFSRYSTGLRYTYYTPRSAKKFVDDTDDENATPRPILLELSDQQLLSTSPSRKMAHPPTTSRPKKSIAGKSRANGNRRYRASIRANGEVESTTLARKHPHTAAKPSKMDAPKPTKATKPVAKKSVPVQAQDRRSAAVKAAKAPLVSRRRRTSGSR